MAIIIIAQQLACLQMRSIEAHRLVAQWPQCTAKELCQLPNAPPHYSDKDGLAEWHLSQRAKWQLEMANENGLIRLWTPLGEQWTVLQAHLPSSALTFRVKCTRAVVQSRRQEWNSTYNQMANKTATFQFHLCKRSLLDTALVIKWLNHKLNLQMAFQRFATANYVIKLCSLLSDDYYTKAKNG